MMGVVLDTCVVSESMRPRPDARVLSWLGRHSKDDLFITSTVLAEIAIGVNRLPMGRRRTRHEFWLDNLMLRDFAQRILPFDQDSALLHGRIAAQAISQGRSPGFADAQIAAVALRRGFSVATRDVGGFTPLGVPVINPWDE
jgi:toxin FitB